MTRGATRSTFQGVLTRIPRPVALDFALAAALLVAAEGQIWFVGA
ncbi:MAG: hypothetical protein QOH02_66, partial [Gaiellaceae bacterium]|nr:hypothetical protein [Gaiellaceae bacterium]